MKTISNDIIRDQHEALYKQIPEFKCKEGCTDCCGPVPFTQWEWEQIKDKRKVLSWISCPYGDKGRCEIYEQRPLLCRMFGAIENSRLTCPHGCRPLGKLSDEQASRIMNKYMILREGKS